MDDTALQQLATAWIRLHREENGSAARKKELWSFDKLWDLCRSDPDAAWKVILEIVRRQPEEKILANLAAGLVEDLLVYHGNLVMPWMIQYCVDHPDFAKVLAMVWRNDMTDDVWNGLQKLISR
jgi:hypothetical protein